MIINNIGTICAMLKVGTEGIMEFVSLEEMNEKNK